MQPVIAVVGPTAAGKSAVAQRVAELIDGEIASADSMQIYRGMDIGTGKVPVRERTVPYFGIDIVDPGEAYSASLFQDYARAAFRDIDGRGKRAVLVGGTGFYVRAAIDAYEFPAGEQVGNPVRDEANAFAERYGSQALWDRLHSLDPQSAAVIHPHNVKRVIRALELHAEGASYADQLERLSALPQAIPAAFFGLSVPRDVLYKRIDSRVEQMVADGLVDEVSSLLERGFRDGVTAPQAIGYKEIVRALDGECSLADAVEDIQRATRRYAKRQGTWFRKDSRIAWIDAEDADVERIARRIVDDLRTVEAGMPSTNGRTFVDVSMNKELHV